MPHASYYSSPESRTGTHEWRPATIAMVALLLGMASCGEEIPAPSFTGVRAFRDYPLAELVKFIDWSPFFASWELVGRYPQILEDEQMGEAARDLFRDAQAMLEQYRWPGNVRELRNAIERAMLLADKDRLAPDDFTTLARSTQAATFRLPPEGVNLEDVERQLLVQALERSHGNQTRAGALLGINRDQVRYRIEKFGLTRAGAQPGAAA